MEIKTDQSNYQPKTLIFSSGWQSALVAIFFLIVLCLGIRLFPDYNLSCDENVQRHLGQITWEYVFTGEQRLLTYTDRYYGPAFEIVLYGLEKLLQLKDTRQIFLMRHLATYFLFCLGVFFFYRLGQYRLQDWRWGLLGCLLLLLSPRIWAHAFYNSKDIPFLTLSIMAIYTLVRYLDRKTLGWAMIHALVCGLAIDIRVLGILFPGLTLVALALDFAWQKDWRSHRTYFLINLMTYLAVLAGSIILFWPLLWNHPLQNFIAALKAMGRFSWPGDLLYLGKIYPGSSLPWHYALVWISVTTPLSYLLGFVLAGFWLIPACLRHFPQVWQQQKIDVLCLAWFFIPLAMVIMLRSVLYNGWRQLFFIYPALLLLALVGGQQLFLRLKNIFPRWKKKLVQTILILLVSFNLCQVVSFMIFSHPYQDEYFNLLVGGIAGAQNRFELDYWGLTYGGALKHIMQENVNPVVPVYTYSAIGRENAMLLALKDRQRLVFTDQPEAAQYFLRHYWPVQKQYHYSEIDYQIQVAGVTLLTVYKLKPSLAWNSSWEKSLAWQRRANFQLTQTKDPAQLFYTLDSQMRNILQDYVRDSKDLKLDLQPFQLAAIRQGRIKQLRLQAHGGRLGDFRHQDWGVPFRSIDLTVKDLELDLKSLSAGRIAHGQISTLVVNQIELEAQDINQALAQAPLSVNQLRLQFEQGKMTMQWLGPWPLKVSCQLMVAPDREIPESDNIWWKITDLHLAQCPLPSFLVQWFLRNYNPILKLEKLEGKIKLGQIRLENGRLQLGIEQE